MWLGLAASARCGSAAAPHPSPMRVRLHLVWRRALRRAQDVRVCVCAGALHHQARHSCRPAGFKARLSRAAGSCPAAIALQPTSRPEAGALRRGGRGREHLAAAQTRALQDQEGAKGRFRRWASARVPGAQHMNICSGAQARRPARPARPPQAAPERAGVRRWRAAALQWADRRQRTCRSCIDKSSLSAPTRLLWMT